MANFMERSAMRRAHKKLDGLIDDDEEIIQFDVGKVDGARCDVVATDRAVVLVPAGDARVGRRLPYPLVAYVSELSSSLSITPQGGEEIFIDFGRGVRGVGQVIQEQLSRLQRSDYEHPVSGGTIRVHFEPWRDQCNQQSHGRH